MKLVICSVFIILSSCKPKNKDPQADAIIQELISKGLIYQQAVKGKYCFTVLDSNFHSKVQPIIKQTGIQDGAIFYDPANSLWRVCIHGLNSQ